MIKIFLKLLISTVLIGATIMATSAVSNAATKHTAIFAMGCFWCGESEFKNLDGIYSVKTGYAGGTIKNPTYKNHPGYKEAIKIEYDGNKVSYSKLLEIFWKNVDPLDGDGQFCDRGFAYTSAVYYKNQDQKILAEQSKDEANKKLKKPIKTEVIKYTNFYDAEEYHQDYKSKNPVRYNYYRWSCGRDARLAELWG